MKYITRRKNFLLALLAFTVLTAGVSIDNLFYKIPEQTLKLYEILGDTAKTGEFTINEFEISALVKYSEYREYLNSVKKDSSEAFYLSQLPDTNISADKSVYLKYISGNEYDNFPVLGISWDNAMNYCKWKTIKDNPGNNISFVYRLPQCSEWLAAKYYLDKNNIKNDLDKNYSDWLFNTMDESVFVWSDNNESGFAYDNVYLHGQNDLRVRKRKLVIGSSFLYQQENYMSFNFSFYADQGYRQISFRYIKEYVKPGDPKSNANRLLKKWNLK